MAAASAGFLEFRDHLFRFHRASCIWSWGGLDIKAEGSNCSLKLVAVPFPDAEHLSDLPGRVWEPNDDDMAYHADVFAEGWFEIRKRQMKVNTARIECKSYNAEVGALIIEFRFAVEDSETGRRSEVDGAARCTVAPEPEPG